MFGSAMEPLFAARLQSFDRSSQKDLRLSSAALEHFIFIEQGRILKMVF